MKSVSAKIRSLKIGDRKSARRKAVYPGAKVSAYLNIEGRSIRGVVLKVVKQGIWVQVQTFPAPILFPHRCVRIA